MTLDQITILQAGIREYRGYCTVPSLSHPGTTHRVTVNSQLYSERCDCKGAQAGSDCGHRCAVDRFYDSRREQMRRLEQRTRQLPVRSTCDLCGAPTHNSRICGRCIGY